MLRVGRTAGIVTFCLTILPFAVPQTQTTGRIVGAVKDSQGAVIAGTKVRIANPATAETHAVVTDGSGTYSFPQLPPGRYEVRVEANGFQPALMRDVPITVSQTTTADFVLRVARRDVEVTVNDAQPLVRTDDAALSSNLTAHEVETLPLPTRNFLQLLTTAPGVSAPLTNNSAIGRNSPNVSVNGSRVTQNDYEINGVDANDSSLHVFADVAAPAPESIEQVNIQTSLGDASVAGAPGTVQLLTKSGSNSIHANVYEYFRNEFFNANDANLKAAGEARPVMRRNVYGGTLGGPLIKNRFFYFFSYQGTRETNGATDQSIYKSILIAPGLTDDRSAANLSATFRVPSIDPISLNLLNFKLPSGAFLIPTPQTPSGRVTGTATSTYHEEQFNTNLDYRYRQKDTLSAKFFYAHAPLFSALAGSNFGTPSSVPGFGTFVNVDNHVLSVQSVHTFSSRAINEARFGYNLLRHDEVPQESLTDRSLGLQRSTADQYPGLPLIELGRDQGAGAIGTSDITYEGYMPSFSISDTVSLQRGTHNVQFGGGFRHSAWHARAAVFSYGEVDFPTFQDFLIGNTGASQFLSGSFGFAHLGTGVPYRDFVTSDHHFFFQDHWRLSPKMTVDYGLRYELDMPPYESQGRLGGFDPSLYRPPTQVDANGFPLGPPAAGIIEADNGPASYLLPGVTRVGKRLLKSIDPNNFGPRVGLAWSPLDSRRLAVRAGYGIFYSRPSFSYLALQYFAPPFFFDSDTSGQPFNSPFANAPPDSSFPLIEPGSSIGAELIDRNSRTPYTQQFTASVQYQLQRSMSLQVAYAGSRGIKLYRGVEINQARIASAVHPIINAVTGQVIIDNSPDNAALRAPLQGVSTAFFALNESTAQSTYHSLQVSLQRQFSRGLQFSAAYTFSKSIDNASNPGGGANSDGSIDRGGGLDTANVWGNQLDPHANRGLSDFDRTHYFAVTGVWEIPPLSRPTTLTNVFLSNWQFAWIATITSGLPVDIFDTTGGALYGLFGGRPNWAPGASSQTAVTNVPSGYYFNPAAFMPAVVQPGQAIPSAHDATAIVTPGSQPATDIGNVGRNVLRGPRQANLDVSLCKKFLITESKVLEFRGDLFNVLNHSNRDNPISDISSADFGKVVSFSASPRIVQLAVRLTF